MAKPEEVNHFPICHNMYQLNIKNEKVRQMAEANSYYYATVLRKQKTIDFLISL